MHLEPTTVQGMSTAPTALPSVFVVGEALIDIVVDGDSTAEHPGGSPMNVAFGLARLGVPTSFRTSLGRDERGNALRRHLDSAGVQLDSASVTDEATSTAKARIQPDRSAQYDFDISWNPGSLSVPTGVAVVHTGSIATVLHPGADAVADLFTAAHDSVLLSFDPNARPSVTPDRDAAVLDVDRIAEVSHVVKLSDEDAAWLHPGATLDEVLDRYLGLGAGLVAITCGGEGCIAASPDARIAVAAPPVDVVDTIGAGDAFMSGLLFGILSNDLVDTVRSGGLAQEGLEAIVGTALVSAQITVSRAGANPPTPDELYGPSEA